MEQPIAVLALAGRFPGRAESAASLWEAILAGEDLIETVPAERWSTERFHRPGDDKGLMHASNRGGFVRDVDRFDPAPFGISPREAETMDPAQRLLLEATWRCWEDAGLRPGDWSGRSVGVFVGAFTQDYLVLQLGGRSTTPHGVHSASGTAQTLLSNRISNCYGLTGPSMTIDTACSSSLVALHVAVTSLSSGESELAFVGGSQLQLTPFHTALETRGGFLSPDGRCKAFDERADGYVRAEAVAAILLAPLKRALSEGWPVRAVIRGTGVNQNGRSIGISHPNSDAQAAVIRSTLQKACISPRDLGFIEAHGTGTRVGDLAELQALSSVVEPAGRDRPLLVGSVKTNIGHTEAAAGMCGLVKVILSLEHRLLPPHLHWTGPPEGVSFDELGLRLPLAPEEWPVDAPYAGVSSFGFGGTNAFAVLSPVLAADRPEPRDVSALRGAAASGQEASTALLLSAPSPEHLVLQATALAAFLRESLGHTMVETAAAMWRQRELFPHRLMLAGVDRHEFAARLEDYASRPESIEWIQGRIHVDPRPLTFVFAGMGPQWFDMGRQLAVEFPAFRNTLVACDEAFRHVSGWSVLERARAFSATADPLPTEIAQPLHACFQIAMVALLDAFGVSPAAALGHSVGEIAAFVAAGAMTTSTAMELVHHRSRLQARLAGSGGMVAVEGNPDDVRRIAGAVGVSIAAENGPSSLVVAGATEDLGAFLRRANESGLYTRQLQVEVPYHSSLMESLKEEFLASIGHLSFTSPEAHLFSSVTGGRFDPQEQDFAAYWWSNVRQPVRFSSAMQVLRVDGFTALQEIGAQPVLTRYMPQPGSGGPSLAFANLVRKKGERHSFLECLGRLHVHGWPIRWDDVLHSGPGRVALPGMAWNRQRYWSEAQQHRDLRLSCPEHALLGTRQLRFAWPTWTSSLNAAAWKDHLVLGRERLPASAVLQMLHAAALVAVPDNDFALTNVALHRSVTSLYPELTTTLDLDAGLLRITNEDDELIAEARIATSLLKPPPPRVSPEMSAEHKHRRTMEGGEFYERLAAIGYAYGPLYRTVRHLGWSGSRCIAEIAGEAAHDLWFPEEVLDGALQTLLWRELMIQESGAPLVEKLPVLLRSVRLHRPLEARHLPCTAVSTILCEDDHEFTGSVVLHGADGERLAELEGVVLRGAGTPSAFIDGRGVGDALFSLDWVRCAVEDTVDEDDGSEWILLHRGGSAHQELQTHLRSKGLTVRSVAIDGSGTQALEAALAACSAPPHVLDIQMLDLASADVEQDIGLLASISQFWMRLDRLASGGEHLWIVTEDAWNEVSPAAIQVAAWGLARGLLRGEGLAGWKGVVDLVTPSTQLDWCGHLERLVQSGRRETEFCLRGDAWHSSQLVRCVSQRVASPLWLRPDATYLVTGAFGALGRSSANYLVERGARHLALLGRAAPVDTPVSDPVTVERAVWIESLRERGVHVFVSGFDCSDAAAWDRCVQTLATENFPPVRGIVHSAGTAGMQSLATSDTAEFARVFAPKVLGLDRLSSALPLQQLDFLLLYSSVAGLTPLYGQSVYAAANLYLDGMAAALRARGVPARSLAWGPWTVGMASDERLARVFTIQGFVPVTPQEGLRLLEAAIAQPATRIYCAAIDLPRFGAANHRYLWQFHSLLNTQQQQRTRPQERFGGDATDALADLVHCASKVLGVSADQLDEHAVMIKLGMDSLMAVELQILLAERWPARLPLASILGREPLSRVAAKLLSNAIDSSGEPAVAPSTPELVTVFH